MQHFPIFLALDGRAVVVAGGGEAAEAKLRLLFKTVAALHVFTTAPSAQISIWAASQRLTLHRRAVRRGDLEGAALAYIAHESPARDAEVAAMAQAAGTLFNIVDNLHDSQFITPAIVDRDPVTIAIGTEGTAPVLARAIKASLEAELPVNLGLRARAAQSFRAAAEALPQGAPRRAFWSDFFSAESAATRPAQFRPLLDRLFQQHAKSPQRRGALRFAMVAHDDPDMLTLKARKALHAADVVIHDATISGAVLELARREATFTEIRTTDTSAHLIRLLQTHVGRGHVVLVLSGQPVSDRLVAQCRAAGMTCDTIAGVPPSPVQMTQKESA